MNPIFCTCDLSNTEFEAIELNQVDNMVTVVHLGDLIVFINTNRKDWLLAKVKINDVLTYSLVHPLLDKQSIDLKVNDVRKVLIINDDSITSAGYTEEIKKEVETTYKLENLSDSLKLTGAKIMPFTTDAQRNEHINIADRYFATINSSKKSSTLSIGA